MHPIFVKSLTLDSAMVVLGKSVEPNDQAFAACIAAAIGAWRENKAEAHLAGVRAVVNGETVPLRFLEPSLN